MNFSNKVSFLSFVAMCLVVYGHTVDGDHAANEAVAFWLTGWNVPFFFFISGIFFAKTLGKYAALTIVEKKTKTLVVPFLIWCIFGWALNGFILWNGDYAWHDNIFGIPNAPPFCNPTLWYVEALIKYMVIVLMMYKIVGKKFYSAVVLICYLVAFCFYPKLIPGTAASPVYFIAGLLLTGLADRPLAARQNRILLGLACVIMIATRLVLYRYSAGAVNSVVRIFNAFSWIVLLWAAYDLFGKKLPVDRLLSHAWTHRTFFVYCCHFPLAILARHYMAPCVGSFSYWGRSAAYLIGYVCVVGLSFGFAELCARVLPRAYRVVSGGR